jgi:hypothetical protein
MNIIRAKKERNSFRDFTFRARFSHGQQGPELLQIVDLASSHKLNRTTSGIAILLASPIQKT